MTVHDILKVLAGKKLPIDTELATQLAIQKVFQDAEVPFTREKILDKKNRPDFFIEGGLVVEVKIRGTNTSREIYRQLERYSTFEEVTSILLITGKATGMPAEINGKPITMMSLGRNWL